MDDATLIENEKKARLRGVPESLISQRRAEIMAERKKSESLGDKALGFIKDVAQPFTNTVNKVADAGLFGAQKVQQSLNPQVIEQDTSKPVGQQFSPSSGYKPLTHRSEEELKRMSNLGTAAIDTTKDVAGVASWAVPAGKTVGAAAKAGAASGFLTGVSEFDTEKPLESTVNTGLSTAGGSVFSAAMPFIGSAVRKVLPKGSPKVDNVASQEFGKAIGETTQEIIDNTAKEIPQSQNSAKMWLSAFTIPTKRARALQTQETAKEMLDYGIKGSLEDIDRQVSQITNMTTRYTNSIVSKIKGEIPLTDAGEIVNKKLKHSVAVTPEEKAVIIDHINDSRGELASMSGTEALAHVRELEKLGHQYLNTSTYLTGNIKNEQIGEAYIAAADALKMEIEKVAAKEGVNAVVSPQVIAAFTKMNPKLGEKIAKATSLSEIRAIAAPFVRTQIMTDLTNEGSQSAFNKLTTQLSQGQMTPTLSNPIAPVSAMLQNKAASPEGRTAAASVMSNLEKMGESVGNKVDEFGNKISPAMDPATRVARGVGAELPALGVEQIPEANASMQENTNQIQSQQNQENLPHGGNITQDQPIVNLETVTDGGNQYKVDKTTQTAYSMDGQWKFDNTTQQWVPSQQNESAGIDQITPELILNKMIEAAQADGNLTMNELENIAQMQANVEKSKPEASKLDGVIDQMSQLYGAGTKDSLSQGKNTVGIGGLFSKAGQETKKVLNQDYVDRLQSYQAMRSLAAGIINRARDAGTLNQGEYELLTMDMPDEYSSEAQAANWFRNAKLMLSKAPQTPTTSQ